MQRLDRFAKTLHADNGLGCQPFQFEMIGRYYVGQRQRGIGQKLRHALLDEDAGAGVADHRIAAIERARGLRGLDRAEDRSTDRGIAEIAGENRLAARPE